MISVLLILINLKKMPCDVDESLKGMLVKLALEIIN